MHFERYSGIKEICCKNTTQATQAIQKRIVNKLAEIEESYPPATETKLKGNNPFHRIRVGDYRIVYEIQNDVLVILVIKIGHCKDIYRRLS